MPAGTLLCRPAVEKGSERGAESRPQDIGPRESKLASPPKGPQFFWPPYLGGPRN